MKNAPRADVSRVQFERSEIVFEGVRSLPIVGHRRSDAVIQQPVLTQSNQRQKRHVSIVAHVRPVEQPAP